MSGRVVVANCAQFLPDGKFVACYADESVRIWALDGKSPPRKIPKARAFQLRVSVSPRGDRIACVAQDGGRILNIDGHVLAELRGHRDRVTSLAFTHDSTKLLTGSADRTVRTVRTWFVYTKDLPE